MGEPAEPRELAPGTMLDDKYRIDELLAVGGMGAVYVGTHIKLRKRVAIKVLNPQLSSAPMIERFHREAITASLIGHEGIAQVTDIGTSLRRRAVPRHGVTRGRVARDAGCRRIGAMPIDIACELALLDPVAARCRASPRESSTAISSPTTCTSCARAAAR